MVVQNATREVCIHSLLDFAVGLKFFAAGAQLQHADKRASLICNVTPISPVGDESMYSCWYVHVQL